ncbi:MAG: BatA domain-containing protein [Flavobacteriaceae bacterium]|nr:BatA domain-containing protein [Flavobacteriaceae bacterium]
MLDFFSLSEQGIIQFSITLFYNQIGINNPEVLYFLFLLIIPILIHFFQLQKFKEVTFTNVKLLKQIEQQTRKSSKLKKLLILLSRLLLFACLILAFSQPFFSKDNSVQKGETFIYLDNSLSMQAKGEKGELLQRIKHNLMDYFHNEKNAITLITNNNIYKNLSEKNLKNELLKINYYPIKKDLKTVLLQIKSIKNKNNNNQNNIVLISDFQKINSNIKSIHLDSSAHYSFVQTLPKKAKNISVDSIWISQQNSKTIKIKARIKSYEAKFENLSISLYNNDLLFGKTTVTLNKNKSEDVEFYIPNSDNMQGKISLNDNLLPFDNNLFFSILPKEKTNVLVIGKSNEFLSKIYTIDEFIFTTSSLNQLDYSILFKQNLIILNELVSFPKSLIQTLKNYLKNEGNLVVIPSQESNIISYNKLLSKLNIGKILENNEGKKTVITINYNNPFFKNVFQKKVDNFQYPTVNMSFTSAINHSSSILKFNDQSDFISEIKNNQNTFYWVAAPLNHSNSNFISSPLVVPVFYNFGKQNKIQKNLYYTIGDKNEIVIKSNNSEDRVLHITNENFDFIPLQTKTSNSIKIKIEYNPLQNGVYQITNNDSLQHIAFNYNREESDLSYRDIKYFVKNYTNATYFSSVENAITTLNGQDKKHSLWQLFIIFALIFLGIEIILQKFLKN